jgi:hypothetical protein
MNKKVGEYYEGNWFFLFCLYVNFSAMICVWKNTRSLKVKVIMVVPDIIAIWYVTPCSVTEIYHRLIEPAVSLIPTERAGNGSSRLLPTPACYARINGDKSL